MRVRHALAGGGVRLGALVGVGVNNATACTIKGDTKARHGFCAGNAIACLRTRSEEDKGGEGQCLTEDIGRAPTNGVGLPCAYWFLHNVSTTPRAAIYT